MNISSSTAPTAAAQANVQRTTEASEGARADIDHDADDRGAKAPASAQPFISKPTETMGNHVNTVA